MLQSSIALVILLASAIWAEPSGPEADSRIQPGQILEANRVSGSLIGIQYENWFTPHNAGNWETAEGTPILSKYDSYNVDVIKKHAEWFNYLGIERILIDWTNMLWTMPPWEAHTGATKELEDTIELFFKTISVR